MNGVPVFSQRAVEALREFLEPNGELLPLITKQGSYFAYNVLSKSTALDLENTEADFMENGCKETAFDVEYFAFDESQLKHAIFRIREYPAIVVALRGQCLTIRLGVKGKKSTRQKEQEGRMIVNSLSELLTSGRKSIDDDVMGSIDELDGRKGVLLIHVTCPDVDRIFDIIKPWVSSVEWPHRILCDKLYGNRFDVAIEPVTVTIKQ